MTMDHPVTDHPVTIKKIDFDELVTLEARQLVTDMLEEELDKLNLPLPKESSLLIHINQILSMRPDITETAKLRVEARLDAHTQSMKEIGIEVKILRPIEIDY